MIVLTDEQRSKLAGFAAEQAHDKFRSWYTDRDRHELDGRAWLRIAQALIDNEGVQ